MKKIARLLLCGCFAATLSATSHAADTCIQISGDDFSGDMGFLRIKGKLSKAKGTIKSVSGRIAGVEPISGTLVVDKSSSVSYMELGLTVWIEGTPGVIAVVLYPPDFKSGYAYGAYGEFTTYSSNDAQVVSCNLEP